jgi:bacterioferritin
MKSDPQIIALLNDILTAELTAINQYFLHARLCDHWGFARLYEKIRAESIEEMKHADVLIARILYLEGLPNVQRYSKISVGQDVPEMFALDLAVEYDAVKRFNAGIDAARTASDNGTREILEKMLREEEEHVDWLETQQEAMKQTGVENYLAEQLKK